MRKLDRLFVMWEERKHEWMLEDDLEELMSTRWAGELSERHQSLFKEIAQKSYVKSATISKQEKTDRGIFEIDGSDMKDIRKLISTLKAPLYLLVENETSDKLFLKKLFSIYHNTGKKLLEALEKGHLEFYPSGGRNETIKTIKNLQQKKAQPFYARIFVFVDSDKHYPEQENKADLQEIIDFCSENGYQIKVTYKREIENYLPKEVLLKLLPTELDDQRDEILSMSNDQWDFFDMEKGFNGQIPNNDGLYKSFAGKKNEKYNKLRNGLISKTFKPKKALYKYFDDDEFNEYSILGRCSHQNDPNELLNLVKYITFTL